jgi:putative ABC transport system substrate-binding protein
MGPMLPVAMVAAFIALSGTASRADAQPTAAIAHIGWLDAGNMGPGSGAADFQQGLHDAGFVVGQNLVIEFRYADGNYGRLPDLAAQLARLPVDVIVTSGELAALAAKRATQTVPIVATELSTDPVQAGLVRSLGRPEGNVTGIASISEDLWGKRLALLREIAPGVGRVAALWNPSNPGNAICVDELKSAAPGLAIQLRAIDVHDASSLDHAFAICWDAVTFAHAKAIARYALSRRLPTVAPLKEYAQAGALLSFGASLPVQRRRSAYYVKRILTGAKPSDLPVERPTLFELVVNQATAKALNLAIPTAIALLCDDMVE